MALVPIQTGPTVQPQADPDVQYRAADFSQGPLAAVGEGLKQLGAAGEDHADFMAKLQESAALDQAKQADVQNALSIQSKLTGPNGLTTLKQGAAVDAFQPTMKAIQDDRNTIAANLTTGLAKKTFDQMADQRFIAASDLAARHVAVEFGAQQDATDNSRIAVAQSDAGNSYQDEDIANKHVGTIVSTVEDQAAREGWTPDEKLAKMLAAVSPARQDVGVRLAQTAPNLGVAYVARYGSQMTNDSQQAVLQAARVEQSRLDTEARRQQEEVKQQQREAAVQIGENARDLVSMADHGIDIDPVGAEKLATSLDGLGKGVLATNLRTTVATQGFVKQARTWTPDTLSTWLTTARTKTQAGANPTEGAQMIAAEKLLGQMRTGVASDPLSWAAQSGVAALPPVDINHLEDTNAVGARVKTALAVADHYQQKPVFLTHDETAALTQQVAAMKADDKIATIGKIATSFGRYAPSVLGSISSQDPVFAHAAGLASMGPAGTQTAHAIFAGQDAMKDKAVALPGDDKFMGSGDLNGAMAYTPKTRGAVYGAAKAIYASQAAGKDASSVDEGTWQKALNQAAGATYRLDGTRVGGLDTYHGTTVVLPPTAAPGEIGSLIGHITDGDLKANPPHYGNGKPASAADIHSGYLFDAGSGRYFVSQDKAGTQFLKGAHGPYVLDLGGMLPTLRGRQPTSVLGRVGQYLGF